MKYEYMVEKLDLSWNEAELNTKVNSWAKVGWRLVAVVSDYNGNLIYHYERPIIEP